MTRMTKSWIAVVGLLTLATGRIFLVSQASASTPTKAKAFSTGTHKVAKAAATATPTPAKTIPASPYRQAKVYPKANATLISDINTGDLSVKVYKFCDGPNLLYISSEVGYSSYNGRAPAVSTQVQYQSPECLNGQ